MGMSFADGPCRLDEAQLRERKKLADAQIIISELYQGKRIWFLEGSYRESEGFCVFPIRTEETEFRTSTKDISRVLTFAEAKAYAKRMECTNKMNAQLLIDMIKEPLLFVH